MTRQDIAAVLRPSWPRAAHPLMDWTASLIADRRGWGVRLGGSFAAFTLQHVIEVPHGLVTDADVASCLHEIGHLVDPRDRPSLPIGDDESLFRPVVSAAGECAAWLIAISIAGRRWTNGMQDKLETSLASYRDVYAARFSLKELAVIGSTMAYTRRLQERRGVVYLRPPGPVPVPAAIRDLLQDVQEAP